MAKDDNTFYRFLEAYGRQAEQRDAIKAEIIKMKLEEQRDRKKRMEEFKFKMAEKAIDARMNNPQQFTQEQQYLRRRYAEQNPIAAMQVPEQGQQMTGISYPSDTVGFDSKKKMYQRQPLTMERQYGLLSQKVQQMQAEGRQVHPVALKLLETMRQNLVSKAQQGKGKGENLYDSDTGKQITDMKKMTIDDFQQVFTDKQYPEAMRETAKQEIARRMGVPLDKVKQPGWVEKFLSVFKGDKTDEQYNTEQEQLIEDNMEHYGKSREEIIEALKKVGKL